MKIPTDKLLHFTLSAVFTFALSLANPIAGISFTLGLGLGKEYGDSKAVGNKWDWWDWWDILADGDALDYSGNGNDGTNYSATFVEDNPEWNQQANGEPIALPDDITQKQVWVREKLVDGQTLQGSRAVVKGRRI
jgi:hypothetical protein